jgi:hypothetical protein
LHCVPAYNVTPGFRTRDLNAVVKESDKADEADKESDEADEADKESE